MPAPVNTVAANLRRLRAERGMSTVALARDSGVARATLAQLEAGRGNPTLETLYALANALGVALADVIAPPPAKIEVVRAGEGPRVEGAVVRGRLVSRLAGRAPVEVYELALRPGRRQRSQPHPPGVVEHLLVQSGRVRVGPESAPVELGAGDFARYPADVPHVYEALEPAAATLLIQSP